MLPLRNKALLSSVNDGVAQVHENEKQLEIESKKLHDENRTVCKADIAVAGHVQTLE